MRTAVTALVTAALLGGCATAEPTRVPPGRGGTPPVGAPVNDPALTEAADVVEPLLADRFPHAYAGVELDHVRRLLIVHRVPDARLDEAVRAAVPRVEVAFRDARMNLRDMRDLADRVLADQGYWRERGIDISAVGPRTDGSGVRVVVADGGASADVVSAFAERYGTDAFTIDNGEVIPLPGPSVRLPTP